MRHNKFAAIVSPSILSAILALATTSCTHKQVKQQQITPPPVAKEAEAPVVAKSTVASESLPTPASAELTEASLRGAEFANAEGLEVVHFDYDSAALKDAALSSLKKNAQYLKDHPDMEVQVAGFCDQRGTIEYNLALGQKRAKEVREYYIRLGVPAKSMATISYGKEKLVCSDSNEDCWSKNRRAETQLRSLSGSHPTPQTP